VGSWYWIGVAAGIGTGIGIVLGALIPEGRPGVGAAIAATLAVAAGIGVGLLIGDWVEAAAGGAGGLLGASASVPIVAGALRGGGTRFGVAMIIACVGVGVVGLAFVPALGYVEAAVAPLLAMRIRKRGGERYAGLRILSK
jgi:hypothetical protein